MRILLLNYEFPPLGGGAGNATFYIIRELAKRSDITIDLVTSSTGKFVEEHPEPRINIYRLNINKSQNLHNQSARELLTYSWKAYWFSRKLLNRYHHDIVHAFFGIPCGFIAYLLRRPYIVSLRGMDVPFYSQKFYWLDRLLFRWLSVFIWRRAQAVIANSAGLRKLALHTAPQQLIRIIPNGVDITQFNPATRKVNNFTLVTVARLIPRKGIEDALQGFAGLANIAPEARFIIVGDGPQRAGLESQAHRLGIAEQVRFSGQVSHEHIQDIYNMADVFILPSHNEGMSNSVLEAMASGLPIITTDTGGSLELVSDDNGIIIDKHSPDQISAALKKLFQNRSLVSDMSFKSRERAVKMSWENISNNYFTMYQKCLH